MTERPLRFGVSIIDPAVDWPVVAREAERLGYDVLSAVDHVGRSSPFPGLVAAAAATERIRLGTYVANASFWEPELLAREAATVDRLSGGRLELGIGAGQSVVAATAGWSAQRRLDHLTETVERVGRLLSDPEHLPQGVQAPRPPLLIGGHEDAELALAAREADTVAFIGARLEPGGGLTLADAGELAERVAFVRAHTAGREPEFNIGVKLVVVTEDRRSGALAARALAPQLSVDRILDLPTVLIGTHREIAEQIRRHRADHGFGYITVLGPYLEQFAPVIRLLREDGQ
ncbi:TIGR03621 family F420-dependent LLM class oxidoreductase [Kitasatospora sp. NPDC056184]|uniref:TIGR03621 family F420-dependent LLM class oxidoreductase n=1 Tax=Kitasatospora sp. NPDC056184 TaxID=3345738 RepID=UPI0035DA502B